MKTIKLPDCVPLADIVALCRNHGLRPEWCGHGIYKGVPINAERHTNQGIVKFPHRHRKIMHARLPDPPEAA